MSQKSVAGAAQYPANTPPAAPMARAVSMVVIVIHDGRARYFVPAKGAHATLRSQEGFPLLPGDAVAGFDVPPAVALFTVGGVPHPARCPLLKLRPRFPDIARQADPTGVRYVGLLPAVLHDRAPPLRKRFVPQAPAGFGLTSGEVGHVHNCGVSAKALAQEPAVVTLRGRHLG